MSGGQKGVIAALVGSAIFWGIEIIVTNVWPAQSAYPPAILYIPLQTLLGVIAVVVVLVHSWWIRSDDTRQRTLARWLSIIFLILILVFSIVRWQKAF